MSIKGAKMPKKPEEATLEDDFEDDDEKDDDLEDTFPDNDY